MIPERAFIVFILIGGFASLVNLLARVLLDRWTGYEAAIVLAFVAGVTTAYVLNRALVFRPTAPEWRGQFARFVIVNLATLAMVFGISMLFARVVFPIAGMRFHPDTVAHAIGLLAPLLTSYWAHRNYTFAEDRARPAGSG